jgi:phage FluMu protein Com
MSTARFAPCPHCNAALSYLEGVSGSSMSPKCPRCHADVTVSRSTFLMLDHSRPSSARPAARPIKPQ